MARAATAGAAAKAKPRKEVKEHQWAWNGMDRSGNRVKGEMLAPTEAHVKQQLRKQGVVPARINKKSALFGPRKKPIKAVDIAIFSRQMSTMLTAGVPLVQSLDIIGRGHDNPSMRKLVLDIKANIEDGNTFADSLARHPKHFNDLFVNLVDAGERAGALEDLLEKVATYQEKTEALKSKIKKAMYYPAAVVVVAVAVTAIMLVKVVPQFESLFQSVGSDLPAFTKMVVGMSEFAQEWWWIMLAGAVVGIIAIIRGRRASRKFRKRTDIMLLKVPIVGTILEKSAVARYARTLATMFSAGVPLVEALESVAGATGNLLYEDAVLNMRDKVATGQSLQLAMQQAEVFPNMPIQMIAIGEEAGSLDLMAGKVADFYEREVEDMVDGLTSLLEPVIIVFMGVVVGGLVIAMYLPIFKIASAF